MTNLDDKLKEALNKVDCILLPSLWEGLGEGRSYGKEKNKYLSRAFSPRRLFVGIVIAAPLPYPLPEGGNLLNQNFL